MKHTENPRIELAAKVFMVTMFREAARRHPQRIENPVPMFESLGAIDRRIIMNAIGNAVTAYNNEPAEQFKAPADTESTPIQAA